MTDLLHSASTSWLSWMLLHSVQTSLFVLLVWLVDRVFQPDPTYSYLLWLLALIKALVPPFLSVPIPGTGPSAIALSSFAAEIPIFGAVQPASAILWSPPTALFLAWLGGVLLFAIFLFCRNLVLRRALRGARTVDLSLVSVLPGEQPARIAAIPLYEAEGIRAPMLVGLLRPRVVLPATWRNWEKPSLRLVLSHEVAHARRLDLWVRLLQLVVLTAFFFNPFIWLVHSQLNRFRELACDESALDQTGSSASYYCRTLCAFVERSHSRPDPAIGRVCLLGSMHSLKERITYLLNKKEDTMKRKPSVLRILAMAAMGLTMVAFSWQCGEEKTADSLIEAGQEKARQEAQATVDAEGRSSTVGTPAEQSSATEVAAYDTPPMPVDGFDSIRRKITYPEIARRAGIQGRVVLRLQVDESGQVGDVQVLESLGEAGCDEAAIEAVKGVAWKPATTHDGQPLKVWITIPVMFKLDVEKKG